MLPFLALTLFTLAEAVPQATSSGNCVGTISSLSDVSAAVQCTTVNINAFTVPAGKTFSLDLLQGTTVNVLGEIQFGNATWKGPLFEVTCVEFRLDGLGGGAGGVTKPCPMMVCVRSTEINVHVVNSPERCFAISNPGPLVVSGVIVDDSQGKYPNPKSNGRPAGHNTDGFDVAGDDVVIANSTVINQDDCLAINRGQNIVFKIITARAVMGSISSDRVVEGVVFRGNTVVNSVTAFRIKTDKGATNSRVTNVTYIDNTAINSTSYGVLITQSYPESLGTPGTGVIISDISFYPGQTDVNVVGGADMVAVNCGVNSCTGRGSQQPRAASTPKNNDHAEKWESLGTMPPPDSSSPVGLGTDSSPFSLPMTPREGIVDLLLLCRPHGSGQLDVKATFNDRIPTTTPVYLSSSHSSTPKFQTLEVIPARTNMGASLQVEGHPANTSERSSSVPGSGAARFLDEPPCTISDWQVVADDISVSNKRTKSTRSTPCLLGSVLVPTSCTRASSSVPTILDLAMSTELESASSHNTENSRLHDATITRSGTNENDGVLSKMPSRRMSLVSVSCPTQATLDNCLKRRRSPVDCFPEAKKLKSDRIVSHVSCASNSSIESKYQATEPASIRRARSLRSEVSGCSEESTNSQYSLFYPSPLSSPTSRPIPDKDYPPTVPSTPLPNSVDYARSKANPLLPNGRNLLAQILERSRDSPYQAIDRLKALLLRERSERERDGLIVHDEKRTERLKETYTTDLAFSRRDSASTSDSSDGRGQWEEESTLSAIESQESQAPAPSVEISPEQYHLVDRRTWFNAFGIGNDFRKEITEWILKKLPKEPGPCEKPSRDERRLGTDLYDQLTNSFQTRFHAAQLFHRYFLHPEKVQFWGEGCKHERLERESWGSHDGFDWERGVWDLAVACMALSVKLHRDCLPPLGPVYAAEFLDMAPYSMTHKTFELAQRDVMYTLQFLLGSCTPQDVLDELWNALPTLRKATAPMRDGWAVVQCVTWDKLFESLLEPDMLQYPVTLLTAAALVEGLMFALARQYRMEAEADVCQCKAPSKTPVSEWVPGDIEPTPGQIHRFEATQLVDDVILDVIDVLQLSDMEDSNKLEKGEEVSWNWGSGQPSGKIADIVEEGAAKVTTKKGNLVSRNAKEGDPAVKITREGNDVVKLAHELNEVDEKR
ncbi:hypothetical protein J3R83DRAFT_9080 [Lanmaoa asiatica]|nr:hypothetical protein J3R83DRAFT_9080 [Lanmaoa asiatica]